MPITNNAEQEHAEIGNPEGIQKRGIFERIRNTRPLVKWTLSSFLLAASALGVYHVYDEVLDLDGPSRPPATSPSPQTKKNKLLHQQNNIKKSGESDDNAPTMHPDKDDQESPQQENKDKTIKPNKQSPGSSDGGDEIVTMLA